MKTIQMTIDEPLLIRVDKTIKALNMTRSAFIREALEIALRHYQTLELEKNMLKATLGSRLSLVNLISGKVSKFGVKSETGQRCLLSEWRK